MKIFAVRKLPPLEPLIYLDFYAKCDDALKRLRNESRMMEEVCGTSFDIEEIEVLE